MEVCGPETHIIAVVPMALELQPELAEADSAVSLFISAIVVQKNKKEPVAQAAPCTDNQHRVRLSDQNSAGNDRC